MKKTRVFIVDDHPLMRSALEASIEAAADMQVVGQAVDGEDALSLIPKVRPDIVIMDLMMPKMNGWDAIAALKRDQDQVQILVLSSATEEEKIIKAVQAGARGYVTKDTQRTELLQAIRTVAEGNAYLPPQITGKILRNIRHPEADSVTKESPTKPLTRRQKEVLDLMGQGLSNKAIAKMLHISKATLRVHTHHMMNKLGFENRRELVVYAVHHQME